MKEILKQLNLEFKNGIDEKKFKNFFGNEAFRVSEYTFEPGSVTNSSMRECICFTKSGEACYFLGEHLIVSLCKGKVAYLAEGEYSIKVQDDKFTIIYAWYIPEELRFKKPS